MDAAGAVGQAIEKQDLEGDKKEEEKDVKKAIVILKSVRTLAGASDALKFIKMNFPEAKILKDFSGCESPVYSIDPAMTSIPSTPTIIVEQDLQPVVEAIKESDIKENSGRDYITKEDVEEYIDDRYSEGLGCDVQILSSDEPIIGTL